jgi:hypothetical protein
MEKNAHIILVRDSGLADKFRSYKFFVNGTCVAKIKDGETIEIPIQPGDIEIFAKMDWMGSKRWRFKISKGQSIYIFCKNNLRGWRIFLATYYGFFEHDQWIILEQIQDPDEIARLFPGSKSEV